MAIEFSDGPFDDESMRSGQLLQRYRDDLRRVIEARLDRRLTGRLDASDVVQDVLVDASPKIQTWITDPDKSVFACLYQLARTRVWRIHRDHISRSKRSVKREIQWGTIPDDSAVILAARIASNDSTPSGHLIKAEQREHVQTALSQLDESDREILVMRILEGLSANRVGEVLNISAPAVHMRHLRALQRIRPLLVSGQA